MHELKIKNRNNPLISYLNVKHLRNKVIELRPVVQDLEPIILAIAETKLNDSFPSAQFRIDGYCCPQEYRKDRTYNSGGGLLIYVKKGIPTKRLRKLEPLGIESIFIEIHIKQQKWCIINIYRSEDVKVDDFLSILSKSLDQVIKTYENIMVIGDMNIDYSKKKPKIKKLKTFCDAFDLTNLIKSATCFQSADHPSSIDLMLTNKNRSFIHSNTVITGLSDWHAMVTTMLQTQIKRVQPTEIQYRSYKNFNEASFLTELEQTFQNKDFSNEYDPFNSFMIDFENIVNKHAPLKSKILRGNDAPFMTKKLRQAIWHRSKLRKIAFKSKLEADMKAFRKQRNKCTQIRKESKR